MLKTKKSPKGGAKIPKARAPKSVPQVPQDSDLSDSDSEDTFQATQAPPMTQLPKVAAASSDSDFASDDERVSTPHVNKLTGKTQLLGISPILAKLSRKNTSTPLRGASKNVTPLKPSQQIGDNDSDSDESQDEMPAAQGRASEVLLKATHARVNNISKTQHHQPESSDSEYEAPWANKISATQKANVQEASDSSDLDSDDDEAEEPPVPVRTKAQSPMKAKVPQASESSDLDSDDEEDAPPVPVQNKPRSPIKAKVPQAADSSDVDSDEEAEKPQSPIKAKVSQASDSSDLESEDEDAVNHVPVRTIPRSPIKANIPQASDSSDLESVEEEEEEPVSVQTKSQSPIKTRAPVESRSDTEVDSDQEGVEKSPLLSSMGKPQLPTKAIAQTVQDSDSDEDSEDAEPAKPPTLVALAKPPSKKSSASESESDSDDNEEASSPPKPKPASPAKSAPSPTAMEVDESSDDEAALREAMMRVNAAEERARAEALMRKKLPMMDLGTDDDEPKSAKLKKLKAAKTPTRTPNQPAAKESLSFISKEIISGSEDSVSSDSEPEKLGPIRRNVSPNKSITSIANKSKEPVTVEEEPQSSSEEEETPVIDNTPGLLYLEDLGSNDEVWLVRCPVNVKHSDLIGRKLVLGGVSKFTVGDTQFESRTYQHGNDHSQLSCLLRSKNVDGLLKVVSVPTAGQVTFTRRMKMSPIVLPATTPKEGITTSLPSGLKTRHPLFGADYKHAITVRDKTEDRPQTTKVAKKETKRRSVTFRENPSFEHMQTSNQETNESEAEEKLDDDEGGDIDDLVASMVSKKLLGKKASPRKQASKILKTSAKAAESPLPEVKSIGSIDHLEKISKTVKPSKRKSLKAEKLPSSNVPENLSNEVASSPAKTAAAKVVESLSDSSTSKTKRKSLKLTPAVPAKTALSPHPEVKSITVIDQQEKVSKTISSSKRKSLEAEKLSRSVAIENIMNSVVSSTIEPASKVIESLSDSSTSKAKRKSLKLSPATPATISSSDALESLDSKQNISSKKDIPNAKSPPTKAKKATITQVSADLSVSNETISQAKKSNKKESTSKAKKSVSLVNDSDSSIIKPEAQNVQGSCENNNSHADIQLSKTKKKTRKSSGTSAGSTLLTEFLSKSLSSSINKSLENAAIMESHADSPSKKSKAKSLKAPGDVSDSASPSVSKSKVSKKRSDSMSDSSATKSLRKSLPLESATTYSSPGALTNGCDVLIGEISSLKDGKTKTPDLNANSESKKKTTKSATPSKRSVSAISSTSKAKSPKEKNEEKPKGGSLKEKADIVGEKPSSPEQKNLMATLMQQIATFNATIRDEEENEPLEKSLSKSRSRKSLVADSVSVKKDRVMIKAKRRIGKTTADEEPVSQDAKEITAPGSNLELTKSKSAHVDKEMPDEKKLVIDELMRQCLGKQKKVSAKKRSRDDGDEGVEGEKAVKKSKGKSADSGQDTPTSSKTSSKLPVKKYRQLTLTSTIPPGIAELSPVSAKARSNKSSKKVLTTSLEVEDPKSPAVSDTTPSKQKKKRKLDTSVSDLETGSKKRKPTAQTEMGSQDASFTSKFQKAGYAGPDSPLPLSSSLGASQSDIDVRFESQDSIGLVANLDTNQFEVPVKKKVRKSLASRDKLKLDASIDFEDFGSGGKLISSTQKPSPKVVPSARSSQGSDFSDGSQEHPKPTEANKDSPFVFKAPRLSKGKGSKSIARGEESGFESDGSSSRKRGEIDGFESDVTLKLFRTQPDPITLAKQRAKKHNKNV